MIFICPIGKTKKDITSQDFSKIRCLVNAWLIVCALNGNFIINFLELMA